MVIWVVIGITLLLFSSLVRFKIGRIALDIIVMIVAVLGNTTHSSMGHGDSANSVEVSNAPLIGSAICFVFAIAAFYI